jgi:hypothetical protein
MGGYRLSEHCVCMCDDDNDMEMAEACAHAYLPALSSSTMEERVLRDKEQHHGQSHYTCTANENTQGTAATEAALDCILQELGVTEPVD